MRNLFRNPTQSARKTGQSSGQRRQASRKNRTQLEIQVLEDRSLPSVVFTPSQGPETTQNPGEFSGAIPVDLVFWGSDWKQSPPPGSPSANDIINVANTIMQGPYFQGLDEYGINPKPFLDNVYYNLSTPKSGQFGSSDLSDVINTVVPGEQYKVDNLPIFVVVTAPGVMSYKSNAASYNTWKGHSTIWLGGIKPNGMPADATMLDYYSDNFSHEMAEAITDVGAFWFNGVQVSPNLTGDQICDNEAENYTYRVNGALVQSFWSNTFQGYLVPDGNHQLFTVSGGNLYVIGGQEGNLGDQITINSTITGGLIVTLNGETVQFDPGQISEVWVFCANLNSTITMKSLPDGVALDASTDFPQTPWLDTEIMKSSGGIYNVTVDDVPAQMSVVIDSGTVSFSPSAQNLSNIQGSITVNNASVTLDDYNGASGTTYQIKPGEIDRNNTVFLNDYNIDLTLNTARNTTVTLGSNGVLGNLLSSISVNGICNVVIDDSADTNPQDITISTNWLNEHYIQIGSIYVFYDTVSSVTVKGGAGNNWFDVESTAAPITLDTGTGTNEVNVGGASNAVNIDVQAVGLINDVHIGSDATLASITAPVSLSQSPGAQIALVINDADDPAARTVWISNSGVTFTGPPPLFMGPSETVNFQGVHLHSLLIDDPCRQDNWINLISLPAGINGVTIYDTGSRDSTLYTPASLVPDIWFTHPIYWGTKIPLPNGVILVNPDGTNLGLM
jgi:hypothetical protein